MFFPINRDKRPERTPYVTYLLITANSLIWSVFAVMGTNQDAIATLGLRPDHWTIESLFASMFLHVGLLHVVGNMWFLWMFAPKVEEKLGSLWFLPAYLLCGVGAAALHSLLSLGSHIPMVGASGAISGVAGMYFLLFPRSPFQLVLFLGWFFRKSFDVMTRGAVGAWLGEQLVLGLLTGFGARSGVAFWAHVGGFLTGLGVAGVVLLGASQEERVAALRPPPLTADERDELFADRQEQASSLTSLKLNG